MLVVVAVVAAVPVSGGEGDGLIATVSLVLRLSNDGVLMVEQAVIVCIGDGCCTW